MECCINSYLLIVTLALVDSFRSVGGTISSVKNLVICVVIACIVFRVGPDYRKTFFPRTVFGVLHK